MIPLPIMSAKIVQMSEKTSSLLECFSECSLSFEKRYKGRKPEKIMSIDYVICNFVICNFCNNKVFVELQNMNK